MKSQILSVGAVTVLIVVALFAAVYIGFSLSRSFDSDAEINPTTIYLPESIAAPTADPAPAMIAPELTAAPSDTTAIPGYGTIQMKAGERDQIVKIFNPAGNSCYFLVSIILPDGREIYRSDMIAPGETVSRIRLSFLPEAGTYEESALLYSCFSVGDLHPMNGATVKFTLEVT